MTNPTTSQATDAGAGRPVLAAADLAAVCAGIAGVDIPVDADLFLSGISSLDLVRVIGVLERDFGVRLTALDFLDHPTPTLLAEYVNALQSRG